MTPDEFKNLKRGDVIRHKSTIHGFMVSENFGNRLTAVRTVDVISPDDWDVGIADRDNRCPKLKARKWFDGRTTIFSQVGYTTATGMDGPDIPELLVNHVAEIEWTSNGVRVIGDQRKC